MAKILCRSMIKRRKISSNVTKVVGYHSREKHKYKKPCVLYTGSPDSVTVAKLMDSFQYTPEKRDEILRKYDDLKARTLVR